MAVCQLYSVLGFKHFRKVKKKFRVLFSNTFSKGLGNVDVKRFLNDKRHSVLDSEAQGNSRQRSELCAPICRFSYDCMAR